MPDTCAHVRVGGRSIRGRVHAVSTVGPPAEYRPVRTASVGKDVTVSWVANLMIQADPEDRTTVRALSEWLEHEAPRAYDNQVHGVGWLKDLTDPDDNQWGGGKNPECDLWAGALNHADLNAVLARIGTLPWRFPGCVQVFLMDQEQSYFRLHMFRDGRLRQYEPPADGDDQHAW